MEQNPQGTGHVVVTGSRRTQAGWSVGHKLFARAAGEDAEAFQHSGHARSF
jgi:hypothetical protein